MNMSHCSLTGSDQKNNQKISDVDRIFFCTKGTMQKGSRDNELPFCIMRKLMYEEENLAINL